MYNIISYNFFFTNETGALVQVKGGGGDKESVSGNKCYFYTEKTVVN